MTRLETICGMVDTPYILDVGSDHGFVPKMLIEQNRIDHAFVSDISPKCLDKARGNLSNYANICTFLLGDGLSVLDGIDKAHLPDTTAVITGMGGEEIIKILSASRHKLPCYILGAHTSTFLLKDFLYHNNYNIVQDIIAFDGGKFYNILKVTCGQMVADSQSLYFGKANLEERGEVFLSYCRFLYDKFAKILPYRQDATISKLFVMLKEILGDK